MQLCKPTANSKQQAYIISTSERASKPTANQDSQPGYSNPWHTVTMREHVKLLQIRREHIVTSVTLNCKTRHTHPSSLCFFS
jgi:hypothetical protein